MQEFYLYILVIPVALYLLRRSPKLFGVAGLLSALFFGYLTLVSFQEYKKLTLPPNPLTVVEATNKVTQENKDALVVLSDAKIYCAGMLNLSDREIIVPLTDPQGTILIVGDYTGGQSCEKITGQKIQGVLSRINPRRFEYLKEAGFDFGSYSSPNQVWHLCSYCGASNSLLGVIVSSLLTIVCLLFYPIAVAINRELDKRISSVKNQ